MTTPTPSDGETPTDPQSETVGPPHRDPDPPRRTKTAGPSMTLMLAVWIALGRALGVAAVRVAVCAPDRNPDGARPQLPPGPADVVQRFAMVNCSTPQAEVAGWLLPSPL